tara:strand:+ start:306 stop:533 length:228 start_codon:yes stop_codon:yes gene_type:complete
LNESAFDQVYLDPILEAINNDLYNTNNNNNNLNDVNEQNLLEWLLWLEILANTGSNALFSLKDLTSSELAHPKYS